MLNWVTLLVAVERNYHMEEDILNNLSEDEIMILGEVLLETIDINLEEEYNNYDD